MPYVAIALGGKYLIIVHGPDFRVCNLSAYIEKWFVEHGEEIRMGVFVDEDSELKREMLEVVRKFVKQMYDELN